MPGVALKPAFGELEGLLRIGAVRVARAAFVQGHHYICAYNSLCINVVLWGELMLRAVYVGAEKAALFGDFAYGAQGKDLKASAVRENRPVPAFEFVKASGGLESVKSGPEIEVVGVPQNDFSFDVVLSSLSFVSWLSRC